MTHRADLTRASAVVALAWALVGCAGTPPPRTLDKSTPVSRTAAQTTANPIAATDPWAGFNRRIYRFNALADQYVLLPAVHMYHAVTPKLARKSVGNFLGNVGEITTFANAVLQLKPMTSLITLSRFVINSTIGVAGLFDPATGMGLYQRNEDFGQTLGRYGVPTGPYLVLPFFGPSNLRDAVGLAGDQTLSFELDPLQIQGNRPAEAAYYTAYTLNKRDSLAFRYYQTGSPFEYILVRTVYLNYRALQVDR
ncbi:VacJ family lipoprotein [Salinisphaera sp. USBA-960]|uniref:MlaA family lipoprotein n=1 Tax=Salinisphaera orenii TaxID=856731 RepID=UPI000DBE4AF5|nr:VacJ family lipoprotein [Salifodinibacter halophilus]NNC26841.1 VacJ family lipoprotein [Salifodinibacter halophilus]